MKPISKSSKLAHVGYDIRGPVLDRAREMEEEGQKIYRDTFYIPAHPKVPPLEAELTPGKNKVTHLTPTEVEDRMSAFYDRKYDVLLSTTIVESGLDIPNANTILIDRADQLGLDAVRPLDRDLALQEGDVALVLGQQVVGVLVKIRDAADAGSDGDKVIAIGGQRRHELDVAAVPPHEAVARVVVEAAHHR